MTTLKKNDRAVVRITDLTKQGEGIGKADGFALFVKDTVPGDLAEVVVTKVKKTYGYARLLRVQEPSPDRVETPCPAARRCGGCQLQMMAHARQLLLKEKIVRDALERIGSFTVADRSGELEDGSGAVILEPVVSAGPLFRYRNKAVIPVGSDKEGNAAAGFYAGRTHVIIPCGDCLLGPEEYGMIIRAILEWMREEKIPAYDEKTGTGLVRHVFFRRSRETGEILICLIVNGKKIPEAEALRKKIGREAHPEWNVAGVLYSVNRDRTNVIFGEKPRVLWGVSYITDSLFSELSGTAVRYRISPMSFYQVNPYIAEKMYDYVAELAGLTGVETVFDLYCGIGTISLFLAGKAGSVTGVEVVQDAVRNARENAALNGLTNVRFLEGKAEDIIPALYRGRAVPDRLTDERTPEGETAALDRPGKVRADVVVVDPPRKGCDPALLDTIAAMQPEKIIYVSCDPATLARDARILCEKGYRLISARPYDQFIMTVHVECICLLSKENEAGGLR